MKNILKLCLLLIAVGWTSVGFGQCSALTCNTVGLTTNDVMCGKYAEMNWDWESTDCKYWYYNTNGIKSLPHPFCTVAQSGRVKEISDIGDYKKENGWVLIKREFGCYGALNNTDKQFPYFILYNKYTGLLRMFVNAPNLSTPTVSYNYVFKLTALGRATSVSSSSPIKTPDKYLQSSISDEALFYYHPESVGGSWIVGEFNLGFEPNIKNAVFNQSELKIELILATSTDIKATIKGSARTFDNRDLGGVNFSTEINSTDNSFKTAGKKIFEFAKSGGKSLNSMHSDFDSLATKMSKWSIKNPQLIPYTQKLRSLQVITDPKFGAIGKPVAKFFNTAKSIGEAFGIVGDALNIVDAVGDFTGWWNMFEDGSTISLTPPTTTNYNLELEGKISSTQLQTNAVFTIPSINNIVNNTNYYSYYNSPVGIFNLQSPPQAQRVIYNRYMGYLYHRTRPCFGGDGTSTITQKLQKYQSIKISENFNLTVNSCADLQFQGMNAAIYISFKQDPFSYDSSHTDDNNSSTEWCGGSNYTFGSDYNMFLRQFLANQYEIVRYDKDNNVFIFRTKYYDYRALKNLSVNVPYDDVTITLKTIATFTKNGGNIPLVFSKEYCIDFIDISSNFDYDSYYNVEPKNIDKNFIAPYPFSNGETPPSRFVDGNISMKTVWEGYKTVGQYKDIVILEGYPNIVSNLYLNEVKSTFTYNTKMIALNSINVNTNVDLIPGCELLVSNGYNRIDVIDNTISPVYASFACNKYSSSAQRQGSVEDVELENTIIAPNPFEESFLLNLAKYVGESKSVKVFSQLGNEVKSFLVDSETNNISVNMKDLSSGLYLVKIENNSISETIKVIKQ